MALTREQQETLVRTDGGTPMGELFRRYWIPALLAEELPEPDCPPVRVRLLGEDLLAFRDSDGRLGLIDQYCPHRGVSLFYGRNEECGIRCSYHGWKFDVTGQCVDMPSEPEESNFKNKVKLTSYPLVELGHVLWAYLGPPETQPPLPEIEWARLPNAQVFASKRLQRTNYLQALEGGIDSSHVSFTHKFAIDNDPLHDCEGNRYIKADGRPRFEVVESDAGLLVAARRNANEREYYWRITQFLMPWYTIIPPFGVNVIGAHAWVPIDDETCWAWSINYHPVRDLTEDELRSMRDGHGIHVKYKPGTYEPLASAENDYLIDRQAQKDRKSFSGVEGIAMQDASLQESMGAVQNRQRERLGTSDSGIIMARQRLLRAAKALAAEGVEPPGRAPESQHVRSASILLPKDVPFQEGAAEALRLHPHEFFATL